MTTNTTIANTTIAAAIDNTIAARKEQLPVIKAECARVTDQLNGLSLLQGLLDDLLGKCADAEVADEVRDAKGSLANCTSELQDYAASLAELQAEFTRDTLNIGVSGAARTGKSTTLQHITGLSDRQIPSGSMNPVTAVRSEIYNSARDVAVVTFKSERSFIEGYVRPHVANVNACLGADSQLAIGSLAALKAAQLPKKLEGSISVAATDSLKRLHEAKRSAATYERFLGAEAATVSLDDVSRYVVYPTAGAEKAEADGGPVADRRYLAVELVRVYCQFPNLGDAKVGLVDLPGLGEIGNSASDIHLKGLEDKVDQIFLVMMPSDKKAFADHEVARNLDQLQAIQPVVKRGDLVVAGINRDMAVSQAAVENLRSSFDAEINAGRTDRYDVLDYCAVDDASVAGMFGTLLDRLGELLPQMDRQKVAYCMGAADVSGRIAAAAEQLVRSMDRVLRAIPSSRDVMKRRIDAIERQVVGQLSDYANELSREASADSAVFKAFVADAERIHKDVADRISDGMFRANADEWLDLTSSSKDYYNLYRDECKRIRYEIIDAYCGLDRFYGVHVSNFKLRVLGTVLRSCGMDRFFDFGANVPVDEQITKVASELGSTLHDDDLESALRLLASMKFDFRSNVFLQIEGHLSELANPGEAFQKGRGYGSKTENKREILGGAGSSDAKQEKLAEYLRHDANAANNSILAALKGEEDRFNKYLAVSIDFFNNYLFGKDEDNFKQVVIRGLIDEYKPWVLPDADDASKSPIGRMAREVKERAQALGNGRGAGAATMRDPGKPSVSSASAPVKKADEFAVGQVLIGRAERVETGCVHVSGEGFRGVVPKGQVSDEWVNDVRDYVREGQQVRVKVLGNSGDASNLRLSIRQCA